jgi:L-arabinonolactonase
MNQAPDVTRALDPDNYLGEAPIWSVDANALYWINCEQPPELHRWKPATGDHKIWPMPQRTGGVVLAAGGRLTVVLADGIYDFDPATGELTLHSRSPLPAHVKLHECQCDRQGRLWVGSFDHHFSRDRSDAGGGAFFRLSGEQLIPEIPGINVANGLAFSPDGHTLYAADAPTRLVEAFDLDTATGHVSNRRPFLTLKDGEGYPDGATVDAEGGYWLACVGAGALRRYLPDGSLDRVVGLPFSNPTKPAFGGQDLNTLFVTSTKMKFAPDGTTENGGLFALTPGMKGIQEPLFAG